MADETNVLEMLARAKALIDADPYYGPTESAPIHPDSLRADRLTTDTP